MSGYKTVQVGQRVIIMNGKDPLKYLDLTTDKIHKYRPERDWKRPLLKLFKRQLFKDVLFYPKHDGYKVLAAQPNIQNILTTVAENICIWYDGTMHPHRGHNGDCKWEFDGQIFWHK